MWRITGSVIGGQGIIRVGLQKFLPYIPGVERIPTPVTFPVAGGYRALIDTGAQMTCITNRAILENGLQCVGRQQIVGVNGPDSHGVYCFHIGFECEATDRFSTARTYYQWEEPQIAVDLPDNGMFDVIIGMNILGRGDLRFSRDGTFSFEFG